MSKLNKEVVGNIFFIFCLFSFFCASFIIGVWVGNNNYEKPIDLVGKISGILGVLWFGLLLFLNREKWKIKKNY